MRLNAHWKRYVLLSLLLTTPAWPFAANAAPFTPGDDNTVIERLPLKPTDAVGTELRGLRAALTHTPGDLTLAGKVARRYIEQARGDSDPRYLGYAQAALAPWWNLPHPPVAVLVLRAIVRQANHEFTAALADLDTALQLEPRNAQALLTRASIEQTRGEYAAARKTCIKLAPLTSEVIGYACLTSVLSLNGESMHSYALLERILAQSPPLTAAERQWIHGLLAEMAARRGMTETAQRHFQAALAAGTPDSYLLASYADFLLDAGQAKAVIALLRDRTRADPLLLRLALAERTLQLPSAPEHIAALRARFAASRLRGDVLHRREQARFELALENNPRAALQLAEDNWAVQREPADARIFLEAALANDVPERTQAVLAWLAETRLEDVQLASLVKRMSPGAVGFNLL